MVSPTFFYKDTQKSASKPIYLKENKGQYKRWTTRYKTTSKKKEYVKYQIGRLLPSIVHSLLKLENRTER
jgi:hypothetical protein